MAKNRWISNTVGGFFIAAACAAVILPFMAIIMSETHTLPEGETSLPIVSLAEIENNPDFTRESGYMHGGVDWGNRLSYDWSPFAPIQYEADERGTIASDMWKDGSGKYSPSISTRFYQLTFAGMADGLVHDLLERYLLKEGEDLQIISLSGFDNLYLIDSGDMQQIFASHGGNVIYIRYHGYADADRIISLVSEKLSIL